MATGHKTHGTEAVTETVIITPATDDTYTLVLTEFEAKTLAATLMNRITWSKADTGKHDYTTGPKGQACRAIFNVLTEGTGLRGAYDDASAVHINSLQVS